MLKTIRGKSSRKTIPREQLLRPTLFLLSLEEEQVLDMLRRGKAVMEVVPW